ncbi:MAG TPA: hypothetical protein VIL32_00965 [Steroidobacteraceae bacterium]
MKHRIPYGGWRPSHQTLEAIAVVLCSHWAEASRPASQSVFWPRPTHWLNRQAARLSSGRVFGANGLAPR